ncbi:serine hydrolase domain-containing protein [Flavihumibacter solisilvae]|uniref:Beta-lactamase-related domain-containing protein n=1 Tax=Flavihumibacter solisilvae TaxID=1349421 RepID=A0A0C1IG01_9BACT|nr:serine hydrolase [Flavihumibacter solisilvae]KIC93070.1 hypothetical protein OI18_19200 [Flavihumibacter solisilvae]
MSPVNFRLIKRITYLLLLALLAFGVRYAWLSLPIITGYSAKMACSCMYLSGRPIDAVEKQELGSFPLRLASLTADPGDSSVTATVAGLARKKAIYRQGLGCTLINGTSEAEVRKQKGAPGQMLLQDPDTIPWPNGDLLPLEPVKGINQALLHHAMQVAFRETDPDRPLRTRAVVVLYEGQLIAEQYAPGFDRHTPMLSWSMAKSVTSALTGILVGKHKLDPKASPPVQAWISATDGHQHIHLEHLLQQTTGLDFEENYSRSTDATNMLFKQGDMGNFAAARPMKDEPGRVFYYTSGNTNILSRVIRTAVGDSAYLAFPAKELFQPLGMHSAVLEADASGTFVGSSYMFADARDWARFGLLYANDGVWNGQRILPEGWVNATIKPAPAAPLGEYGYQFWLNAGQAGNPANRKFPALPPDMYYADGYEGQYVFIIPSKKLVVVRLGQTPGPWFDVTAFLQGIIESLPAD